MISNTIDTMIAATYIDEPQVQFMPRDELIDTNQAETLNYMQKYDVKEMNYQQLDYQVQWDRYFFWLWIKYRHGFDNTKLAPLFYAVNPMTAIFDPTPTMIGTFSAENYKYFGFTMRTSMYDLKNDTQYDNSKLSQFLKKSIDENQELFNKVQSISDNTQYVVDNLLVNYAFDVYHHFTIYEGKKYLVTTDVNKSIILRQQEIQPVLQEEKKDHTLIPRPFALYFYKPERWKVLWVSIPDLLEDKEEAKTVLLNASLMKARLEAFGGKFVVNSRLIQNKDDILKPTAWPQFIFTNDKLQKGEGLDNVMYELPWSPIRQDVMTMTNILEREAVMDTKTDQMQMWIVPDKTMTKAEQQSVQANANMLVSLNLKTYLRWEYDFWFLWRRTYMEFYSKSDKKFILMNENFERKSIPITRDKFNTKYNPFIIIGSKSDVEALREKHKAYWNAMLPVVLNDPWIREVSKMLVRRFVAKINGMSQNMINKIYWLLPDERDAINYVDNFINNNVVPKALLRNPNADYYTYWIYMQSAEDTEAKEKVLNILWGILRDPMFAWMQGGGMNEMANSSANILTSQLAQQQWWQGIVSKQNVLEPSL